MSYYTGLALIVCYFALSELGDNGFMVVRRPYVVIGYGIIRKVCRIMSKGWRLR